MVKIKKGKWKIIVGTILLAFVGILSFICFGVPKIIGIRYNYENTVEKTAIISSVEETSEGLFITTQEYKFKLYINGEKIQISNENKDLLTYGKTVYFRIDSLSQNFLTNEDLTQVAILSLRTENESIFTLEDMDEAERKEILKMQIWFGIVATGLFAFGVYLIVKTIIVNKNSN